MSQHSLYIQESGDTDAPTIIFLHALGTTSWMWDEQVTALQDFHCLVPDLHGHGRSNHMPYKSMTATATDIVEIIRQRANGGKAHLVGLSYGAMVGLEVLRIASEIVDHALLSGISVLPIPNMWVMRLMSPLLSVFIKSDFALKQNAQALRIPDALYTEYKAGALMTNRKAFANIMRDSGDTRIPTNAHIIDCPTLVVAGENEHELILQSIALLADALPNAQSAIAPQVGHGWSIEAPDLFSAMIRTWITTAPLPDALQVKRVPA